MNWSTIFIATRKHLTYQRIEQRMMSKSASQIIAVVVRPFTDAISKSMLDAKLHSPHGFKILATPVDEIIEFRQDQVKTESGKFHMKNLNSQRVPFFVRQNKY